MSTTNKRDSLLWIPSQWHSPEFMPTIALVIMCIAPYPLCNMGIILRAMDSVSQTVSDSLQNWVGGLNSMPGDTEINVLWPRKSGAMITENNGPNIYQGSQCSRLSLEEEHSLVRHIK